MQTDDERREIILDTMKKYAEQDIEKRKSDKQTIKVLLIMFELIDGVIDQDINSMLKILKIFDKEEDKNGNNNKKY